MRSTSISLAQTFFRPSDQLGVTSTRLRRVWFLVLFIFGGVHWLFFLDFGRFEFDYHDWGLAAHYLVGIREGLQTGQLPLHLNPWLITERFLANPELLFSPQVFLLYLIDLRQFLLANTLILYTAGFIGLLLLARRFNLSAFAFSLLFLIFNLNGHLTAHLAAGHMMWLAYFLTPYLVYLVFDAVDRGADRRWPALVALVLFAILLQGAFHFVLWSVLLIAVIAITERSIRRPAIHAILLTAALGAIRYVPALVEFRNRDWSFVGGFRSANELLEALISLKSPTEAVETRLHLPEWWEIDHHVGLLALGFLVVFGVGYWIRHANDESARPIRALAPGILILAVLALDPIIRVLSTLPIPLLFAERVTSRFFILPLLFVLLFAVIGLDRWLRNRRLGPGGMMLLSFSLLIIALDLWQHSRLWRLAEARHAFEVVYPTLSVAINNHADPSYTAALITGALITVIALVYSGWLILRSSNGTSETAAVGDLKAGRENQEGERQ